MLITKLTSIIYFKGSENSFQLFKLFNINLLLLSDSDNPMLISKCIGENINKSLSKIIDYVGMILIVIAISIKAQGLYIIGTDQ